VLVVVHGMTVLFFAPFLRLGLMFGCSSIALNWDWVGNHYMKAEVNPGNIR